MRVRMLMAGVFLMTGVLALEAGHLRLPRIFSDGMVLQRELLVSIWGWATPAAEVTVAFAGQRVRAVADTAGRWRLRLDPLAASIEPRRLTVASPGQPAESAPIEIANAQTRTFHQKLSDTDEPRAFVTVLYGLATFTISDMRELQKVTGATDHVGAVLLGHQAGLFELIGDHGGPAGQDLKLIGADGQPGLAGGADPERERFRLRFRGADEPGVYTVTLRVVTQAGNTGTRSLGETGEPPIDLFYTDLPATVVVAAAKH